LKILIHGSTPTRFTGGHREPGMWWFRIQGYGLHYKDTRRHRPLFTERNRLGTHRADVHVGPYLVGVLHP
jgi:hypothetical protein